MEKLAAFNTMCAIKKKMHNMKQEKENAFDHADQLEQKLVEHRAISEKVNYLHAFRAQPRTHNSFPDMMWSKPAGFTTAAVLSVAGGKVKCFCCQKASFKM